MGASLGNEIGRVSVVMIAMIEEKRDGITQLCRNFQVKRLELLGSAVRGDFRTEEE